jgi:Ca2+-binding RTX toxin-like protein
LGPIGRLPTLCAALVAVGCVVLAGCGQAGTSEGRNSAGPEPTSQTAQAPPQMGGTVVGTEGEDVLRAGDGKQVVKGLGGNDEIYGGEGRDRLYGGPGDDLIDAQDRGSKGRAGRDEISCGPGRDEVLMDAEDGEKPKDCEMAGVGSS